MSDNNSSDSNVIRTPITDELDLHTFQPREVRSLITEYLIACKHNGISPVRIIHGKGKGILRRIVHAELDVIPWVIEYHIADTTGGHWGATIVYIDTS